MLREPLAGHPVMAMDGPVLDRGVADPDAGGIATRWATAVGGAHRHLLRQRIVVWP
jgi:hypothetical protein